MQSVYSRVIPGSSRGDDPSDGHGGRQNGFVLISSGTFECPIEMDGSLFLSTLQSQLPYASGLKYPVKGSQYHRAIRFDKRTGKFYPPSDGWGQRVYHVATFASESDQPTGNKAIEKQKQEIAKLRSRIRDMEDEKKRLEGDLEEKDKLLSTMNVLQAEEGVPTLEGSPMVMTPRRFNQADTNDKVSDLENKLEAKPTAMVYLENALEEKQKTLDELKQQLQASVPKEELQEAKERCTLLEKELEEAWKLYNDTKWRNGELEAAVAWKDTELAKTKDIFREKEELLMKAETEIEELHNKCTELEAASEGQEVQGNSTEELQWRVFDLEARIKAAEDENRELVVENAELNERSIELQEALQLTKEAAWRNQSEPAQSITTMPLIEKTPDFNDQPTDVNKLQEELDLANKKFSEIQADWDRLRENESNLRESLLSTRRELDDAKWRCGELETLLITGAITDSPTDEGKRRIGELLKEVDRLHRLNDKAVWRVSQMKTAMGTEERELYETRKRCIDLETALQEKDAALKEAESRMNEMEMRTKEMEVTITQLQEREANQAKNNKARIDNNFLEQAKEETVGLRNQLNGANDHIAWLEKELAHYKHLFQDTEKRLDELQLVLDSAHRHLWDAFVIRKEPFIDRDKWKLSMWYEGSQEQYARIWYELDAPDADQVYLALSCYNWECLLLMTWHEHGKWGLWVDVPSGRQEFKFLVDGEWKTSDRYDSCSSGYNDLNNWRFIE